MGRAQPTGETLVAKPAVLDVSQSVLARMLTGQEAADVAVMSSGATNNQGSVGSTSQAGCIMSSQQQVQQLRVPVPGSIMSAQQQGQQQLGTSTPSAAVEYSLVTGIPAAAAAGHEYKPLASIASNQYTLHEQTLRMGSMSSPDQQSPQQFVSISSSPALAAASSLQQQQQQHLVSMPNTSLPSHSQHQHMDTSSSAAAWSAAPSESQQPQLPNLNHRDGECSRSCQNSA